MSERKKYSILQLPIYPFLLALAPALSLFSLNSSSLGVLDLIRPLSAYFLFAVLTFTVAKSTHNPNRGAALLASILIVSTLTYGYALKLAYVYFGKEFTTSFLLPTWGILTLVFFFSAFIFVRRTSGELREITIILNVFAAVIICVALLPLFGGGKLDNTGKRQGSQPNPAEFVDHEWLGERVTTGLNKLPDFYFLILDAYARGDILETRFGFDNSEMTGWLEENGFFIGHRSHANYAWTHLSLSSTFNGEYLQTLVPPDLTTNLPEGHRDRYLYIKQMMGDLFINDNRVLRLFKNLGYRLIANDSGHSLTRKRPTSVHEALTGPLNEYEEELISRSIALPLLAYIKQSNRVKKISLTGPAKIVSMLNSLADSAGYNGPKFVFFHIMSPHEPFSFDSEGNGITRHPVYDSSPWFGDKIAMPGYAEWFTKNYPKNVAGLNSHVKESIRRLLEASNGDAVIIIQSDHGPSLGLIPESVDDKDMAERFGILNAIYLPEQYQRIGLVESISAVNTFPVVLNNIFGTNIETSEDRAFFSSGDLEFIDVSDRVLD